MKKCVKSEKMKALCGLISLIILQGGCEDLVRLQSF